MPWIGGALAAGGSILSGMMGADAANSAAQAQGQASAASIAEQARQFDLTRSDNSQFLKTGTAANRRLASLLGIGGNDMRMVDGAPMSIEDFASSSRYDQPVGRDWSPEEWANIRATYGALPTAGANPQYGSLLRKFTADDLNADPVYQSGLKFGADQGRDAINARATQAGSYDSGATLKALTRFGNDYGSQKANESYNRYSNDQSNIYSRLTGTSGGGQVASGANASAGAAAANSISGSIDAAGNARAAGIVGGANAWGSGLTGAATGYNNYQNNQQLMALLRERNRSAGIPSGGGGDI